jgi:putative proteasome-type protease
MPSKCADGYDSAQIWCIEDFMTYCLALALSDGLVFASDSRTTAGVDFVSSYRKLHQFQPAPDRFIVILTSGSLATSQEAMDRIRRDLDGPADQPSLRSVKYLFEAASYVGRVVAAVQSEHAEALRNSGADGKATFIVGGQIADQAPSLHLIYPEGNYITATAETPFLQLGEFKYGKPVLSRIAAESLSLEDAARLALVSLDATMKSNLSVGPPLELAIYRRDELRLAQHLVLTEGSPLLRKVETSWDDGMRQAFERLPRFDWEA